jgi:hypothetical protein
MSRRKRSKQKRKKLATQNIPVRRSLLATLKESDIRAILIPTDVSNVAGKPHQILTTNYDQLLVTLVHNATDALHPHSEAPEPPKIAKSLIALFLRRDEREAVIGDLVEKYHRKRRQFGKRRADRWIYGQLIHSLLPLIMRLTGKIGWLILGEWIKKHIS